jgi:4-carboxymuconolactone decarboxylase
VKVTELTATQSALREAMLSVWNRADGGPFDAWYRSPELGRRSHELGEYCRFKTALEWDVLETAILVTADHWHQSYEWKTHVANALKAGLSQPVIDAIAAGEPPTFATLEQSVAHDVAREILETGQLGQECYDRARTIFGEPALVELASVIGWYSSLAIQMNIFDVRA